MKIKAPSMTQGLIYHLAAPWSVQLLITASGGSRFAKIAKGGDPLA